MEAGQKINEQQEIVKELLGFSLKKLLITIKELTYRPGQAIAAYCDGERKNLVSPITYFLLTFGIVYFAMSFTGLMDSSFDFGYALSTGASTRDIESYRKTLPSDFTDAEVEKFKKISDSTIAFVLSEKGMLLQIIPVWLLFQWIFFKKFRKPFAHHLYLLMYVNGHSALLTAPLIIPVFFYPSFSVLIVVVASLLGIVYYFGSAIKFYPGLTSDELVIRTIKQFAAAIVPWAFWCTLIVVATYFTYFKIIW